MNCFVVNRGAWIIWRSTTKTLGDFHKSAARCPFETSVEMDHKIIHLQARRQISTSLNVGF